MVVVDNTALFRANAKMILSKNGTKTQKSAENEGEEQQTPEGRKSSPNYRAYASKSEQIAATITEVRNLLLEKRASYLLTMGSDAFGEICPAMTDPEREALEEKTTSLIDQCKNAISNLKKVIKNDPTLRADDEEPHLRYSCQLLLAYLQAVAKIIGQMRTLRDTKHKKKSEVACLNGLAQIYESSVRAASKPRKEVKKEQSDGWDSMSCSDDEYAAPKTKTMWIKTEPMEAKPFIPKLKRETSVQPKQERGEYFQKEYERNPYPDLELTESEQAKFAMENEQLRQRFQHSDKDVEAVEKQIVELQRLQETFAEKVMDQEKDIARVNEVALNTVENIRDGNELIRAAIKNSASRRVVFMFCLIVMTFTLLFLDWYNS